MEKVTKNAIFNSYVSHSQRVKAGLPDRFHGLIAAPSPSLASQPATAQHPQGLGLKVDQGS